MSRRGEDGFALVTTLWFLALLALVAVIVEGWIAASVERATALRQRTDSDAALIGAADRIGYAMTTGGWSPRGLELVPPAPGAAAARSAFGAGEAEGPYIALDGRPYRLGGVTVRLLDEGGLYDLGTPNRGSLRRLLSGYGIAQPDADRLAAALAAYVKGRAELRAGDSGDADYARAGLPAPRHARLVTPWELFRVVGWAEQDALWRAASSLADLTTTGPVGGLDINAAPERVLTAVSGIDEREAARLVAMRAARPIASIADLPFAREAAGGVQSLEVLSSSIIRLRLVAQTDPLAHILSIRLTPTGAAPYRIVYALALPQDAAAPADAAPPDLPTAPDTR